MASPRSRASWVASASQVAATAMAAMVASAAGSRRRNRRSQKRPSEMRPCLACSPSRTEVMRKPERVKKVETLRKAPAAQPPSAW